MSQHTRTLYISDLDGTLLNEKSRITATTANVINQLIDDGMLFTIATARTPATVVELMKEVNISLPVILMTGALLYDIKSNKYLHISSFDTDVSARLIDVIAGYGISPMVYYVDNSVLCVNYRRPITNRQRYFIAQRNGTPFKKYVEVKEHPTAPPTTVLIFFMGNYDKLKVIYDAISDIEGHCSYLYYDNILEDQGYLEIYPSGTSKANAIERLAREINVDEIVSFGDNLNDIPMFEISHRCYAMDNAVDEVKLYATDIIDSNMDDGVARFLWNENKKEELPPLVL